jgi:hypothetical protein
MKTETNLSRTIDTAGANAYTDEACKRILSNKIILAWIMKGCLAEYANIPVEEIAGRYIIGELQIGSVPVFADEVVTKESELIANAGTEDSTITEGIVRFDIKFNALLPGEDEIYEMSLIINIETQNKYNPGYPLTKRGIYYDSRLISSQKGHIFTNSHYEKIKKVCSIWICLFPPEDRKNTITRYHIVEENVVGHAKEDPKNYDLMDVVMLCLGGDTGEGYEGILKLLDVLLTSKNPPQKKKEVLSEEFNIKMSREMESEVFNLCNIGEGFEERGYENGIKHGLELGIEQGLEQGKEQLNQLNRLLIKDNRQEDLLRSTTDLEYQKQLLREYQIDQS